MRGRKREIRQAVDSYPSKHEPALWERVAGGREEEGARYRANTHSREQQSLTGWTRLQHILSENGQQRIRRCTNDDCLWLFLDESKNGTRRWCDMASCGNRAKARRHYLKMKQG